MKMIYCFIVIVIVVLVWGADAMNQDDLDQFRSRPIMKMVTRNNQSSIRLLHNNQHDFAKVIASQERRRLEKRKSKRNKRRDGDNLLSFFQTAPIYAVPPPNAASFDVVGTTFLYKDALFFPNASSIPGTSVIGSCTKIQPLESNQDNDIVVGGGLCSFTYTLAMNDVGMSTTSLSLEGELFDVVGGTLTIVGGTGEYSSTRGDAVVKPLYQNSSMVDVFTEASAYSIQVRENSKSKPKP